MAICNKIIRKSNKVCIGSLNRKVIIYTRSIIAPEGDSTEYTEELNDQQMVWAMVEPVKGDKIFDGSNIIRVEATNIYIRYISGVTFEKWIELINVNGEINNYFQILTVTNLDESNRFYKFECCRRGATDKPINLN